VIASVHIADVGVGKTLGLQRKAPKPGDVPGLRMAEVSPAARFNGKVRPTLQFSRAGLIAFWDDDAALDAFLAEHPVAGALADGWRIRLAPLRAFGTWPGLPEDVPKPRTVEHEGPAAVITIARFRWSRVIKFFRTNAAAEASVLEAPGMLWAVAFGRPPFVATCSLWESADALREYAYGETSAGHPDAITANRTTPFHHQSAFIRFRPYASHGHLDGRNPLPESWMSAPP
jgi:hypothetical protein